MKRRIFDIVFGIMLIAVQIGWLGFLGWGLASLVSLI